VIGAPKHVAEDVAFAQRIALVRAGVRECMRLAVHDEDRDLGPIDLDDGAPLGIEGREWDPHAVHAA
jgi:hypothetical protein